MTLVSYLFLLSFLFVEISIVSFEIDTFEPSRGKTNNVVSEQA